MPKDQKRPAPKAAAPKSPKKKAKAAAAPIDVKPAPVRVPTELLAVLAVIDGASELSDDCRAMMREGANRSLSMGASDRTKVHAMFVGWIEEIIDEKLARLQEAVDAANAEVSDIDSSRAQLENQLVERTSAVDGAKDALALRKQSMSSLLEQISATRLQVSEAHQLQRNADAALVATKSDKDQLDEALRDRVPVLKEGCEPAVASSHVKALLLLAQRMSLDESFLNALPASGLKPASERGSFDNTVLDTLEKNLYDKAAEFAAKAEEHEGRVAECKRATEAIEAELASKHRQHQELEACLAADNDILKTAVSAADSASKDLAAFQALNAPKIALRQEKVEALEGFKTYEVECFGLLRDKKTPAEIADAKLARERLAAEKAAEKAAADKAAADSAAAENVASAESSAVAADEPMAGTA